MLNNPAINITDIKSTIPRYQLSRFSRLQLSPTGDWVRYCDHTQALAIEKILYAKAKEQTETVREQLSRMVAIKDNHRTQATKMELDNISLRRQLNKLECAIPLLIAVIATASISATLLLIKI